MAKIANKFSIFLSIFLMLMPVLHISGQSTSPGLRTVVIDPGHGGKDPGAPDPGRKSSEKEIVLKISKYLGEQIKAEYPSVKVVYTRSGDSYPTLTDRVKIAHNNNADLFISIHCNASKNKSASGTSAHILAQRDTRNPNRNLFDESVELTKLENSVFEFEEKDAPDKGSAEDQILNTLLFHANYDHSVLLAQLVVENLAVSPFHKWGKGIHQNDFLLLKKMTCPAILVETAFLSNTNERQLLVSEKWQKEIANRLFKAFKDYKAIYDGSISGGTSEILSGSTTEKEVNPSKVETSEYYGIQIMGLGRYIKNGDSALKGLEVQAIKAEDSNIYKYVYGKYESRAEAASELSFVKKKFPEAFLVKVEGEKVTYLK